MKRKSINDNFFNNPFVSTLSGKMKLLLVYMILGCDNQKIWVVELDVAGVRLGFKYEYKEVLKSFGGFIFELDEGSLWLLHSLDFFSKNNKNYL